MPVDDSEFRLILNQTVKIGRRSGFTTTGVGDRRPTGETVIYTGLSVYFEWTQGKYVMDPLGNFTQQDYRMYAQYNSDIQPGDLVYALTGVVGFTYGRVLTIDPILDFDGNTHHIEASIQRQA